LGGLWGGGGGGREFEGEERDLFRLADRAGGDGTAIFFWLCGQGKRRFRKQKSGLGRAQRIRQKRKRLFLTLGIREFEDATTLNLIRRERPLSRNRRGKRGGPHVLLVNLGGG